MVLVPNAIQTIQSFALDNTTQSSVDATIAVDTSAKACIAELPPRISAKGPMEIRKREVSFDKWAKWAIQQDMHALAQPVSSIAATSTADQIARAKEMETPVKFQGARD